MAERLDQLAQALFNGQTLAQCSENELVALAQRYPYFSAAQLLLFKKSQLRQSENSDVAQAAALHTYQPLLLQNSFVEDLENQKGFQNVAIPEIVPENVAVNGVLPTQEQKGFENVGLNNEEKQTFIEEPEAVLSQQKAFENVSDEDKLPAEEQMPIAPLVMPPTQEGSLEITFEPFHTVDYFASQGIKLSQKDIGNDNFGKQLKSFTEWLKTMKRVSAAEASSITDAKGESKVVNLAAHSLHNTDVVTEAMADVWVKQGNIEKATDLYNKLSLLNPSKKAYFASKIESLKK